MTRGRIGLCLCCLLGRGDKSCTGTLPGLLPYEIVDSQAIRRVERDAKARPKANDGRIRFVNTEISGRLHRFPAGMAVKIKPRCRSYIESIHESGMIREARFGI